MAETDEEKKLEHNELLDFIISIYEILEEQNASDEERLAEILGDVKAIDIRNPKDISGSCTALSKQISAVHKKQTGDIYLVFYKNETVKQDKYCVIRRGTEATSRIKSAIMDWIKASKDEDIDEFIHKKIVQSGNRNTFPVIWFQYYLSEAGNIDKDNILIKTKNEFQKKLEQDKKKRQNQVQCIKLIVTSATNYIKLTNIDFFESKVDLSSGFFSSMISTAGMNYLTTLREQEASNRLILLGDIPHNLTNTLDTIEPQNLDVLRRLLIRRCDYLTLATRLEEYQKEENEEDRKDFKSNKIKDYCIPKVIHDLAFLDIIRKRVKTPTTIIASQLPPEVKDNLKDKKGDKEIKVAGLPPEARKNLQRKILEEMIEVHPDPTNEDEAQEVNGLVCTTLIGAFENCIENFLINSIKAFNNDGLNDTKIKINIEKQGNDIVTEYKDTGKGFKRKSAELIDSWAERKEIRFVKGEGQGIASAFSAIRLIGGEIKHDKEVSKEDKDRVKITFHISVPIKFDWKKCNIK